MSDKKDLLSQEVKRISEEIQKKEAQRWEAEPAAIPSLDREIRQLKRRLNSIQEAEAIREAEKAANDRPLDEITKAKILEEKMYESAATACLDFNNHENPVLVSIRRLGLTIELVDMLSDVIETNKENAESFPDISYFTEPLDLAISERIERLNQARKKVDDAAGAEKKIENDLQEAKTAGDVEKIISLTDSLEDAKRVTQCLRELVVDEENKKALSAGDALAAWEKVCEVYGYEWRNRLQIVLLAAQIYHENLQQLDELGNNLRVVRSRIHILGEQNGDPNNIKMCQRITNNIPDISKVMGFDEAARLSSIVFFGRGELL